MKKLLGNSKTAIVCLVLAVLLLVLNVYMMVRPISYGMEYHAAEAFEWGTFEGRMWFYSDYTMINRNTNFIEEMKSRYYYKNGYVFFVLAQSDEEYEEEKAYIDANFDEAVTQLFYADRIDAFKLVVSEEDGYSTVYTCEAAIVFAVIGWTVEAVLIGLTCVAFILGKKQKAEQ